MSYDIKKLLKRFNMMKKRGMIGDTTSNILVRRAITEKDLEEAYSLVYKIFFKKKYIDENKFKTRIRIFEALPEMSTFIAIIDKKIVGVISIIPDLKDIGLPSDIIFKNELDKLRFSNRHIVEVTNLAIDYKYCQGNILMELCKIVYAHVIIMNYDDAFMVIKPGHAGFFEDIIQFDSWGNARNYSNRKNDIVEGKRLDLRISKEKYKEIDKYLEFDACLYNYFCFNNYYPYIKEWNAEAKKEFLNVNLLKRLFIEKSDILQQCTESQLKIIKDSWGENLFNQVQKGD